MSKKYQIFVSSTYVDLHEERDQIIKACLEMGHIPVGMEMFSAADEEQWKIIKRQIDEIDYYVVLVAHRYGSITPEGTAYTEKEYDYAVSKGIPILGFLIDEKAPWPADKIEKDVAGKEALLRFKEKIRLRLVNFWKNKDELNAKFSIALMKAIVNNPRSGWTRADDAISADVMKELSRLSSENSLLRSQLDKLKTQNEQQLDESQNTVKILSKNTRPIFLWKEGQTTWDDEPHKEVTLLGIFQAIAPSLLGENDTARIASDIALAFAGSNKYRSRWPVPQNHVTQWITELHALELIEPSKKKHPVADNKDYWSLTPTGRKVIGSIQKLRLMAGITDEEPSPQEA
nr:DUF4062 domain-containing protein [uncultured Pseudomonas sp.]